LSPQRCGLPGGTATAIDDLHAKSGTSGPAWLRSYHALAVREEPARGIVHYDAVPRQDRAVTQQSAGELDRRPAPFTSARTIRRLCTTVQLDDGDCAPPLAPGLHRRSPATSEDQTMLASRFDTLFRSLISTRSRRGALATALGGVLVLLGLTATTGKPKKHKKKRRRPTTKNPVSPSPSPSPVVCTSICSGGQTCQNGACACSAATELCDGECVTPCPASQGRDPSTCVCCKGSGVECSGPGDCCSTDCTSENGLPPLRCNPRGPGSACTFNAQCAGELCRNGTCTCPSGTAPCGGFCFASCPGNTFYIQGACRCCIANGVSCASFPAFCCAGPSACTGPNSICVGKPDGAGCNVAAECASSKCFGGQCGGPPVG
jgi:hypothetical protein